MKATQPEQVRCFLGIDVQIRRGCAYYVLDGQRNTVLSGWTPAESEGGHAKSLKKLVAGLTNDPEAIAVGIDAPRMPLADPRPHYWHGSRGRWRKRRKTEAGFGRHCEIVIKAYGLGNPQWTPVIGTSPAWMKLGYSLYGALKRYPLVYEVFPTVSYKLLDQNPSLTACINFSDFARGPKDMLDACMAALTVYEFMHGKGYEVGGGDGLGTIVLPRPLPAAGPPGVHIWPRKHQEVER